MLDKPERRPILTLNIDATSYSDASERIISWAQSDHSGYVCIANVHMAMEAYHSDDFSEIVNNAVLILPDGMPLVWGLRLQGVDYATRVYGPDLTLHVLSEAETQGIPVGFYGGTPEVLVKLRHFLDARFPGLKVAYAFPPPFRPLTEEEDADIMREVNASDTKILFVGLGCPKQEYWMAEHCEKIQPISIGVGAAFDFLAGNKPHAPVWMRKMGFEWLFRLFCEPKRLWYRYLVYNPQFIFLFTRQLLRSRRGKFL